MVQLEICDQEVEKGSGSWGGGHVSGVRSQMNETDISFKGVVRQGAGGNAECWDRAGGGGLSIKREEECGRMIKRENNKASWKQVHAQSAGKRVAAVSEAHFTPHVSGRWKCSREADTVRQFTRSQFSPAPLLSLPGSEHPAHFLMSCLHPQQ